MRSNPNKSTHQNTSYFSNMRVPGFSLLLLLFVSNVNAQSHFWFGNIHSHSEYSDGNMANDPNYLTAKSCYEYVQQKALNVNFWGISDHNHAGGGMQRPDYHKGIAEADSTNMDGIFPTFYGMEWGVISTGGHVLIYGIDSLIGWEAANYDIFNAQSDYNSLFNMVAARGDSAFAYLAHMESTDFGGIQSNPYNALWDSAIVGMAIKSGPAFSTDTTYSNLPSSSFFSRYLDLLKVGYHLAPGFDHDNHNINFGRSHPGRTVVIADSLSRESLMKAFRQRSFYASDDWNTKIYFSVSGYGMGNICNANQDPFIKLVVDDPDLEDTDSIKIYYGVPGSGTRATILYLSTFSDSMSYTHIIPVATTYYYFAEITQADGNKIWTAPIWFTRNPNTSSFELIDFTAMKSGNHALLDWSTLNEFNTDYFNVEKSTDGVVFNFATTENATGSLGNTAVYSWLDPDTLFSSTWYRLNIFDINGLSQLSPVRRVDLDDISFNINIYPNPAGDEDIWCSINHNRVEPMRMEIFSADGKLVLSSNFYSEKGTLKFVFPAELLSRGLYTIRFSNSDYILNSSSRFIRH
jgi:trimeric autotransporter adhesin